MTVTSRIHILVVLPGLLFRFVLFQGLIIFLLIVIARLAPDAYELQTFIALAAMFVGSLFIWTYVQWRRTSIRVNNQAIVVNRGVFLTRSERIDLTGANVTASQNLLDDVLDRGGLQVTQIGGETRYVGKITNFRRVRNVLNM